MPSEKRPATVPIEHEQHAKLKEICATKGLKLAAAVKHALTEWMKVNGGKRRAA